MELLDLTRAKNIFLLTFSGGGGNFKLSTSLCGYTSITGCCPPMLVDGYGVFYAILPNK